jgi:hypothetical protein
MPVYDPLHKGQTRRIILPAPPGGPVNSQRLHWDGRQDARVGGVYLEDEVEDSPRFKNWLADWHTQLAAAKTEMTGLKAAAAADPGNGLARQAFRKKRQELVDLRRQFRETDPRRWARGQ